MVLSNLITKRGDVLDREAQKNGRVGYGRVAVFIVVKRVKRVDFIVKLFSVF